MSNEITFRVKINRLTNKELFEQVSVYPSAARAELSRLAMTEYLKKNTAMSPANNDLSIDDIDSLLE